ncbi:DUF1273 family protein [Bacillus sp. H-16]|uniref:DUF1273 family protein n=2 Tax=Bacillaceae TaxID=186817 RepID=A0A3M7TY93_9BACI|nr:SLOG family protein [Alteribacter salitolerans]MBM7094365.1 DUF1273 family protein [Alteribacter salitolerans]RNA69405.1 DUF1273 family protein [Alteribacter keqinensis]
MYEALAVTGYKPNELGIFDEKHPHLPFLKDAIKEKLRALKEEIDFKWLITSGQPGVEQWAAEALLALKNDYPDLQLATLAPFYEQEERWKEVWKATYEMIWSNSDFTDYITKRPYENPAQLRMKNQFIIEKSHAFLVLYDEFTPGSPDYYLTYAKKKHEASDYPVFYLTPEDIEESIRARQEDWN